MPLLVRLYNSFKPVCLLLLVLVVFYACSCFDEAEDSLTDGDIETDITEANAEADDDIQPPTDGDAESQIEADVEAEWVFDRNDYEVVNGWMLLDRDAEKVAEAIDRAATLGVNHIQLSHSLLDEIDQLLDGSVDASERAVILNAAIDQAHGYGMKVYAWCHELSEVTPGICYDPDDPVWDERAKAYRDGLAILPNLDGIVLMFGSAPIPPWATVCSCEWCVENYPDDPLERPDHDDRLQIITEKIGQVVVNELGREMFIRTFVHEPNEIEWHSSGLAAVKDIAFTGMHKGPVQDWQPYNPHHPCQGNVGPHPSILELDVAGEYYGKSILPFAAPGYYWFRLNHSANNKGIGAVLRVERGSNRALDTPNEINIYAISRLVADPSTTLDDIWNEFLKNFYGVAANAVGQTELKRILASTFPIRRKSHYVLGIWALEKSSDIPSSLSFDQFNGRGKMPKWDADWQSRYDKLETPDKATLLNIWQEGTEAVILADEARSALPALEELLSTEAFVDLTRRFAHQYFAARAWRSIKMLMWSHRYYAKNQGSTEAPAWIKGAHDELKAVKVEMEAAGLADVSICSPSRIQSFIDNSIRALVEGIDGQLPEVGFSPIAIERVNQTEVRLSFSVYRDLRVSLDYGLEIPDYGQTVDVGLLMTGDKKTLTLSGLSPDERYVFRLRTEENGMTIEGGDFWFFTH